MGALLGSWNQLSESLLAMNMWYCGQCGKIDFYYPGT